MEERKTVLGGIREVYCNDGKHECANCKSTDILYKCSDKQLRCVECSKKFREKKEVKIYLI